MERCSSLEDRGNQCYETHPAVTRALLRYERFEGGIYEPACGPGLLVQELRAHGHRVVASDLHHYEGNGAPGGVDFLQVQRLPEGCQDVVMNPPYSLAAQFVAHALDLGALQVAALLRHNFAEGGERVPERENVLDVRSPRIVHVFKKRLPMMHRRGWTGKKAANQMVHAWWIWDQRLPPTTPGVWRTDRITWEEGE